MPGVPFLLPDSDDCLLLPEEDACLLLAEGADASTFLPGSAISAIYPSFLEAVWAGLVDVTDGTLAGIPVDGRVLYDPTDEDLADLPASGLVGVPVPFTSISAARTWVDGVASFCAVTTPDPLPTTGDAGPSVRALVVVYGTALVAYLGREPDTTQPNEPRDEAHDWTFPADVAPWPYVGEPDGPIFTI